MVTLKEAESISISHMGSWMIDRIDNRIKTQATFGRVNPWFESLDHVVIGKNLAEYIIDTYKNSGGWPKVEVAYGEDDTGKYTAVYLTTDDQAKYLEDFLKEKAESGELTRFEYVTTE